MIGFLDGSDRPHLTGLKFTYGFRPKLPSTFSELKALMNLFPPVLESAHEHQGHDGLLLSSHLR